MPKPPMKHTDAKVPAMYEQDSGLGFENADESSYSIPFLTVLQALSPQLNKQDGAYIKGAEQGQILNTATGEVMDEIEVVPCYFKRTFTHWKPRGQGGGFLGELTADDPVVARAERDGGKLVLADGTYLNDTRGHYVLVKTAAGAWMPALMSMTSTQIKKSKQWMTRMQNLRMQRADGSMFAPPMFAHCFKIGSVPESNDQGSWYGWRIGESSPVVEAYVYQMAKAFRESVAANAVKVDHREPGNDDDIAF